MMKSFRGCRRMRGDRRSPLQVSSVGRVGPPRVVPGHGGPPPIAPTGRHAVDTVRASRTRFAGCGPASVAPGKTLVWCLTNTLMNLPLLAVGCVALPRVVHATRSAHRESDSRGAGRLVSRPYLQNISRRCRAPAGASIPWGASAAGRRCGRRRRRPMPRQWRTRPAARRPRPCPWRRTARGRCRFPPAPR